MNATATVAIAKKGERTRRRLLELAIAHFAVDGFRRTSVSDIARAAGLTPAAAYAYFAGKEAMFEAAVDADAAALIDEATEAAGDSGPILDQTVRFMAELHARVDAHPLARRVLAGQEPEVIGRLTAISSLQALTGELVERLADAQAGGEIPADADPAELAVGLETIALSLLMAGIQSGLDDPEREAGVVAVLTAALRR